MGYGSRAVLHGPRGIDVSLPCKVPAMESREQAGNEHMSREHVGARAACAAAAATSPAMLLAILVARDLDRAVQPPFCLLALHVEPAGSALPFQFRQSTLGPAGKQPGMLRSLSKLKPQRFGRLSW